MAIHSRRQESWALREQGQGVRQMLSSGVSSVSSCWQIQHVRTSLFEEGRVGLVMLVCEDEAASAGWGAFRDRGGALEVVGGVDEEVSCEETRSGWIDWRLQRGVCCGVEAMVDAREREVDLILKRLVTLLHAVYVFLLAGNVDVFVRVGVGRFFDARLIIREPRRRLVFRLRPPLIQSCGAKMF